MRAPQRLEAGGARARPQHVVWTKQFDRCPRWILAFLEGTAGAPLVRVIHLVDLRFPGRCTASVDASPWGIGGLLQDGTKVVAKFHDVVSAEDAQILGAQTGNPKFQTVLEGLAILVALRIFGPRTTWKSGATVSMTVRSDSKGALGAAIKSGSTNDPLLNLVGQEISFDQACGDYRVELWKHTPGVANVGPDYLSRLHAPGLEGRVEPAYLGPVEALAVPRRDKAWWRPWDPPPSCAEIGMGSE